MTKLKYYFALPLITLSVAWLLSSCSSDDKNTWEKYEDWREANTDYFEQQKFSVDEDGSPLYQTLTPVWNPGTEILIHYFNDRSKTADNLKPLLTSTVDVKYRGTLYNGQAFDSSYLQTTYGDSIFRTQIKTTIQGWWAALLDMNVGDSVRVLIPYNCGYGASASGVIPPFSTLIFDIKLVDIPYYEIKQ